MHISIWQQFSSNHSADFTVVGTFESPEKAAEVAAPLRQMMREIAIFWRDMSEARRYEWEQGADSGNLTPIEEKWRDYFGVDWPKTDGGQYQRIDWLSPDPDEADTSIILFDEHLLITTLEETASSHRHMVAILEQCGGQTARASDMDELALCVMVTCMAPDEATAEELMGEVTEDQMGYFTVADKYWECFTPEAQPPVREGLNITYWLGLLRFFTPYGSGLESFQKYLEDHRCTNIRFEFTTIPE